MHKQRGLLPQMLAIAVEAAFCFEALPLAEHAKYDHPCPLKLILGEDLMREIEMRVTLLSLNLQNLSLQKTPYFFTSRHVSSRRVA